ncbi:MAG TPA: glycosyltransferase [Polyangiales bacterium]|nr:glycosyltransferase [Polyangiales bacterium]
MAAELDIVVPVYNEGANIIGVLQSLVAHVRTSFRVLICYDHDDDDTLTAIAAHGDWPIEILPVKNRGRGAFGAVTSGFAASRAPYVLVFPADDDYNAPRIDSLVARARDGADIVVASRFIPGGCMVGCPWLKSAMVRSSAFALHTFARLPAHDASNGLRLFSQRTLRSIPLESTEGFTYSIELLVKAHRLGWRIDEVPIHWYQRKAGQSRFRVIQWAPAYLHWFFYAFETTWLRRGPQSVVVTSSPD